MWQHEIVEDLSDLLMLANAGNDDLLVSYIYSLIKEIKEAQTFYFGSIKDYSSILDEKKGRIISIGKIPFQTTLFEYTFPKGFGEPMSSEQGSVPKRACLVAELPGQEIKEKMMKALLRFAPDYYQGDGDVHINTDAAYIAQAFWYVEDFSRWTYAPASVFLNDSGKIIEINPIAGNRDIKEIVRKIENYPPFFKEITEDINHFSVLLNVLNAKNIVTKDIIPPEKLNKKREKNNKQPLQTYKILEVRKGIAKTKHAGTEQWGYRPPYEVAFHLCRGHFKEYTPDAPLFGKYTGRFWWQPQARGSKENGEVKKEYSVKR